ncbi:hypothetical protein M569_14573 [Genlisea aurea]|uniref:Uncharacterized protein n=1 Tax=Genlisea aurea TaxID=192259 RepID=S8DL28_9LAMI|nr:hypothetical protein M569_14573 [Genlisea aurea]
MVGVLDGVEGDASTSTGTAASGGVGCDCARGMAISGAAQTSPMAMVGALPAAEGVEELAPSSTRASGVRNSDGSRHTFFSGESNQIQRYTFVAMFEGSQTKRLIRIGWLLEGVFWFSSAMFSLCLEPFRCSRRAFG